jgi:hypothetical protein
MVFFKNKIDYNINYVRIHTKICFTMMIANGIERETLHMFIEYYEWGDRLQGKGLPEARLEGCSSSHISLIVPIF